MAASIYTFGVRPDALTAYAGTARAEAGILQGVWGTVVATRVEAGWFGKLPQSGHLADAYTAHKEAEIGGIGELVGVLEAVAAGLEATAARYAAADRTAAHSAAIT